MSEPGRDVASLREPAREDSLTLPTVPGALCVACRGALEDLWRSTERGASGATYLWRRCTACRTLHLAERPLDEPTGATERPETYAADVAGLSAALHRWLQTVLLGPEVRLVLRAAARRGARVLDIGCGGGLLLTEVARRRADLELLGIEPRPEAAAQATRAGVRVVGTTVEDAGLAPASIDVVVMVHVLEHVLDPDRLLALIRPLLVPGGTLIISMPAADSWEARLFGRRWYGLNAPQHLWIPSQRALIEVVRRSGFDLAASTSWSLRTPLVGTAVSLFPAVEPSRLRALESRSMVRSIAGQAALALSMMGLAPFSLLAGVCGRGSSFSVIAKRSDDRA